MRSYFKDYGGTELSVLLRNPNEGKLKEACFYLIETKQHSGDDIKRLNLFLNFNNPVKKKKFVDGSQLSQVIKDSPVFKRIVVFIKRYRENPESSTDSRNIEFLAWLINFRPRPFESYRNSSYDYELLRNIADKKSSLKSEKELHMVDQLSFAANFCLNLRNESLIDVLKDYDLMQNESFIKYRSEIDDDIAMQAFTISKLETKIASLQNQLKKARLARNIAGVIGLFFVSIDYEKFSMEKIFDDLLEDYSGMDSDDFFEALWQ